MNTTTYHPNAEQHAQARLFRDLNRAGGLRLPNAWDCASARIFAAQGFPALATTSGGIAYARGFQDAEYIGREAMLAEIAAIVAAVRPLPVSADIEAGYGAAPEAVAGTVAGVIAAGAVGINLEDRRHGGPGAAPTLFEPGEQATRLAAARAAALAAGLPELWINARCDVFLLGLGADIEQRLALTVARATAYLAAGADMVFVPGLVDVELLRRLLAAVDGPISLMALPGGPSAGELLQAGASRLSLGTGAMLATLGTIRDIAREFHGPGSVEVLTRSFYGFGEAEQLFSAAR